METTQKNGDSETHPPLSPNDEFADCKTGNASIDKQLKPVESLLGSYVRSAPQQGLGLHARTGVPPNQFGLNWKQRFSAGFHDGGVSRTSESALDKHVHDGAVSAGRKIGRNGWVRKAVGSTGDDG